MTIVNSRLIPCHVARLQRKSSLARIDRVLIWNIHRVRGSVAAVASLVFVIVVLACASSDMSVSTPALTEASDPAPGPESNYPPVPADPSILRVGTEGYYPPFAFFDDGGRLAGFDIDIAFALCEKMGMECVLVHSHFDDLIPGLLAGEFDAVIASMAITSERRQRVNFTNRYYKSRHRFVYSQDGSFDPSDANGKVVGTQVGTFEADWLEDEYLSITVSAPGTYRYYDTFTGALDALSGGEVDAVLGSELVLDGWLKTEDGAGFALSSDRYDVETEGTGIAVRKEDDELLGRLNDALSAVLADGTYQEINDRYFEFSIY